MKKVLYFAISLLLLYNDKVNAKQFVLEKNPDYNYKLFWKLDKGENIRTITMYKITDENQNVLYNLQPIKTMFNKKDYEQTKSNLDFETYKKITTIIHYGYGYNNHNTDKYYFATQYLVFKCLGISKIKVLDKNLAETNYLENEIKEIETTIANNKFIALEYQTDSDTFEINDEYIKENFTLEIADAKITETESGYKIVFLEEKESYELKLKSKNNCLEAEYWESKTNPAVIGTSGICEEDTSVVIRRNIIKEPVMDEIPPKEDIENEIKTENKIEKEETVPDNETYIEEEITVFVPNTSKYSLSWFIIILILGNLYYVCKK